MAMEVCLPRCALSKGYLPRGSYPFFVLLEMELNLEEEEPSDEEPNYDPDYVEQHGDEDAQGYNEVRESPFCIFTISHDAERV